MNYFAEATPDGVSIMARNDAGICERVSLLAYEDAVNSLDAGKYDGDLSTGYAIHHAVADGGERGWFDFTAQHNVIMWRWLIASTFIAEMKHENGTAIVTGSDGTTSWAALYSNGEKAIPLYPLFPSIVIIRPFVGSRTLFVGSKQSCVGSLFGNNSFKNNCLYKLNRLNQLN